MTEFGPDTVNEGVIKTLIVGGKDPRTGQWWDEIDRDSFDKFYPGNAKLNESVTTNTVGTLTLLAEWGETKDEVDLGQVWRHEETGKEYLCTGTYSSWYGSAIDTVVEAESYTFTEKRWRPV